MPQRIFSAALTRDVSALDSILSLVWLLVCVLVIIVLAYLFTKYVVGRGSLSGMGGGSDRFKVLSRLSLGREHSLALVQAGERYFLVGIAPSGVSPVAELTREEAEGLYAPPPGQQPPPSFGEALRNVLQQKKPR